MPLDTTARARTVAQWMRDNEAQIGSVTKAELRAALDAVVNWVDGNQTSFNQTIPQPARAELTVSQKIDLLMYVLLRRQGRLRAEEDG